MSDQARWEARYSASDTPWDTGQPSSELQRVRAEAKIVPCRAIDMGCGTGSNAVWLAKQGFDVTAADISPSAIDRAKERAATAGVKVSFLCADLLEPPALGGPYGFFFDRGCYHVVRRVDARKFVQTLLSLTQPGSIGLVLTGNAREPHDPGPPVVKEEEIRHELGRDFEILHVREFRFDQVEKSGVRFLGYSCLLRRPSG